MIPTGSSLWLAEKCPASQVLPQVRETSPQQRTGKIVHRFLERAPKVGKEKALDEAPKEARDLLDSIEMAGIPGGQREIALAYNLETRVGRVLGTGLNRSYPNLPGELYLTVDVLQDHGGGRGTIIDYKTGHPEPACESLQLQAAALAAARTFGWHEVAVVHIQVDGDRMFWDGHVIGLLDLPEIHARVEGIMRLVAEVDRDQSRTVYPGEHCAMCDAMPDCKATNALARQLSIMMAPDAREDVISRGVDFDPQNAYIFLKRAEDFATRLRAELKRRAELAPILLPNGKQLEIREVEKSSLNAKVALRFVRKALGNDAADACCEVGMGALVKVAGKKGAAALVKDIEKAGGVERWTERHLKEVRPKKELPGFPTLIEGADPDA